MLHHHQHSLGKVVLLVSVFLVCGTRPTQSFCTSTFVRPAWSPPLRGISLSSRQFCTATAFERESGRLVLKGALENKGAMDTPADDAKDTVQGFDETAYESERLKLDEAAREEMKAKLENITMGSQLRTPWKWEIRQRIWDWMEKENIAREPRPVHHRIPNFDGADAAAAQLCSLPEFQSGKVIKVNPDTPQKGVRFGVLSAGVAKHGKPLTLDDDIKVDLVVVGSTAVCPRTGARVGKGEGFAELEYGMLRMMGAINEKTLVVTSVHDGQVVEDIPANELLKHDVPVDVICTPTRIIRVPSSKPKPEGIYWDLLSPEKLSQVRVLQRLKQSIEAKTGVRLPTGPSETLPPLAERNNKMRGRGGRRGRGRGRGGGGGGRRGSTQGEEREGQGASAAAQRGGGRRRARGGRDGGQEGDRT